MLLRLSQGQIPEHLHKFFKPCGHKPSDLINVPAFLAEALRADGWYLRMDAIWAKKNCMPESVVGWRWQKHRIKVGDNRAELEKRYAAVGEHGGATLPCIGHMVPVEWIDCPGCPKCSPNNGLVLRRGSWRPTKAHEYIFMLAKSERYFADGEAVKEPHAPATITRARGKWNGGGRDQAAVDAGVYGRTAASINRGIADSILNGMSSGRNLRSVLSLASEASSLAHYATFPKKLPETCIKASTSEKGVCPKCGAPWARVVEKELSGDSLPMTPGSKNAALYIHDGSRLGKGVNDSSVTKGWLPTCSCKDAGEPVPATVMDCFSGTGTTGVVAVMLGRNYIGLELSEAYVKMSLKRIRDDCGMLAKIETEQG